MYKSLCVISCPIDTFSGYGAKSRGWVKALIDLKKDEWDIKILPQRWGNCSWGFIDQHIEEWGFLKDHIWTSPHLPKQPEIWIQDTVPNEFQPIGKYNIGFTSGIETDICDPSWILGCNRMNLVVVSSNHAKEVFERSVFEEKNSQTQQITRVIKLEKPVEVLFEGFFENIYKKIDSPTKNDLFNQINNIPESFAYLFVGHWLQGDLGEDRKNVGLLVKSFYETFKNKKNKPALILKTSGANASYMDRNEILKKIVSIRKTVNSNNLPNVYLIHGEFKDEQINELYNHPKVKAMISLTKGEGFGKPLLEFSTIGKPIITTGWSGHIDFLKPEFTVLLPGTIDKIHPSAVVQNMLIPESSWFKPDLQHIGNFMMDVYENYKNYKEKAKRQSYYSKINFSWEKMKDKLLALLTTNIPDFPKPVQLKLPQLKKIELPKLKKVEETK
jgi:glycosyltransferase involved in cell wall biosynthesis